MLIPARLQSRLLKVTEEQRNAFTEGLVPCAETIWPQLTLESTKRYSAFYFRGSPVVYIDPQLYGVKLGFFRNCVDGRCGLTAVSFDIHGQWNATRGVLVGFFITGHGTRLAQTLSTAAQLIFYTMEQIRRCPNA